MRKKTALLLALTPFLPLLTSSSAFAVSSYLSAFNTQYLNAYKAKNPGQTALSIASCTLCHTGSPSKSNINVYATAFKNASHQFPPIEALDSDGDTFSNLTEIMALPETYPGDAASHPPAGDTTKPVVGTFTIPATSATLVVPISALAATDNIKVTGYKVTETATAPLATAGGWTAAKPANYTFTSAGAKTLYGWAKDAAGNVSLAKSGAVTITLTDTAKPVVSGFTIPATSSSLVIPISTLTATDNVKVTGYKVTETAAAPAAGATGWTAAKPANYSFKSATGLKTLYAWAKDASGWVSLAKTAQVTVTQTDTVKPVVGTFTAVPSATLHTATITAFTATDNVAVTGYMLTTASTAPLAGAAAWTATAPTSYTFPASGAKKLYAWAKDAGGNVSLGKVASVTVSLTPAAAALAPASAAPMTAAVSQPSAAPTPVPTDGQQLNFVYAPTELPVVSADPSQAMPIGVGPVANGGSAVNLDIDLGQFEGPVDVYLTLYQPISGAKGQTFTAYSFNATKDAFAPISGAVAPWQSGVMGVTDKIWNNVSLGDLAPDTYMVTLEVTPAGQTDSSYTWTTYFTIQ